MDLITTNEELGRTLTRLLRDYSRVSFAVAWASSGTPVFERLLRAEHKITRAVIGIHFFQTDPDVLRSFIDSETVRFILQPSGVFHPKLYLFWNEKGWEALVGSANLTKGALESNSEAVLLVSGRDKDSNPLKQQIVSAIGKYWSLGSAVTLEDVDAYSMAWRRRRPDMRRLSGQFGEVPPKKPFTRSRVMSMTWDDFLSTVRNDPNHGYKERCGLLSKARALFRSHPGFMFMKLEARQLVAGLPNDDDDRWGWFGSMKGHGLYWHAVNKNDERLSSALDEVPFDGPVAREHFDAYVRRFSQAFPDGRHGIGVASRLLAMKRPDYFVCLDSKNKRGLCEDFGIAQRGMTYGRYWEEIVERVLDTEWWNIPRPVHGQQRMVWDGRVAMLDAIFYEP
jgi:HKD family nuclease